MDILKINTAGSVDDGKSTLIGRLMFDTGALTIEQEELVRRKTAEKGLKDLDLSVITDGLIAEREQGITIDVAHIYFSTAQRKFIIADSPGHVEYTRNMVTGASGSQASIILIDARKGLLEQTYRHFFISRLLRISEVIFCVNKMDLVEYSEQEFNQIVSGITKMVERYPKQKQNITIIPVSSLKGDNIVNPSTHMPWYKGPTLSQQLHNIKIDEDEQHPFFMDVQYVMHVQNLEFTDYRAYAGRIVNGKIKTGDTITVLPSGRETKITEIRKFKQALPQAFQGQSIQISIADDIDISRGMVLAVNPSNELSNQNYKATIVWFNDKPATQGARYIMQAGARNTLCKLQTINAILPPESPEKTIEASEVKMNEIAQVTLKTAEHMFLDKYASNKHNGAFILIDEQSNNTVAVGFVE